MNADNRKSFRVICWLIAIALIQTPIAFAQTRTITVQVDKPGAAVPKTLFGLFFEDINFGADGGLYPERVKNRSFEFPNPMMGWKPLDRGDTKGSLQVYDQGSVTDVPNSHYMRIKSSGAGKGFGLTNEGFRGIGVQKDAEYTFSIKARRVDSSPLTLRVEVEDGDR
ncbi:MAG TPA: hypothetical protein VFT26_07160, partial [Pyrinomonadaceae bacterium]|nr:hypothetical protein [Pyrinomonadaceae bacterium]